jgi:ABC-type ATPase with predicted acetyltransferase domain
MPDTPFKSMTREGGHRRDFYAYQSDEEVLRKVECDKCGALIAAGDWPWCKNGAEDHVR